MAAVLPEQPLVTPEVAASAMVLAGAVGTAVDAAVQPAPPGEQHPGSGYPLTTMPSHPSPSRCRAKARASEPQLFAWRATWQPTCHPEAAEGQQMGGWCFSHQVRSLEAWWMEEHQGDDLCLPASAGDTDTHLRGANGRIY